MPVTIVLGSQWGDEGKGKLVDILASHASMCCRAAGGNNAGHTIVANGQTYDFHILPSGLINPSCKVNLVGAGCVVHLPSFFKELNALEQKGLQGVRQRVKISDRAQVCFDLHSLVDGISEDILKGKDGGKGMIGTTKKGIGPCYSDKVGRRGVTFSMLVSENGPWEQRLRDLYERYVGTYSDKPAGRAAMEQYDLEGEIARMKKYKEELVKGDYILDATPFLSRVVGHSGTSAATLNGPSGEPTTHIDNVLIEGANALLLDVDHGTYPYVTSSNTGLGGVFTGLAGLSPLALTSPGSAVVGVVKAYTTRVGAGPFPTELASHVHDVSESEAAYGTKLQEVGREWGVTTGRKRRCGWLDLVLLKYSAQVNCYTQLNFTKLDVLDDFPEIRVAMAYKDKRTGKELPGFPADLDLMEHHLEIVYKTFEGWQTKTTGTQNFEDLPSKAKEYIEFVEKEAGVPIKWIGTGPRREDMILRSTQ